MTAEIGGGDGFVAPQFVGLAAEHDAAGFQHVAVIGDRKSHARVLLDQQDRGVAPDFRDDPEHRLHDDRREAERGLVQQQQPRLRHQAAGDRDHLQLAARQGPAQRIGERPDVRKQVEHRVGFARQRRFRDAPVRRAEHDVFLHRQAGEDPPPLRHVRDAEPDDRLRPKACDRLAVEQDFARPPASPAPRSPAAWSICRRRWRRARSPPAPRRR